MVVLVALRDSGPEGMDTSDIARRVRLWPWTFIHVMRGLFGSGYIDIVGDVNARPLKFGLTEAGREMTTVGPPPL